MSASTSSKDDTVGQVVYSRNAGIGDQTEDWDDTSLIEAYDAALGGLYDELDKRKKRPSAQKIGSEPSSAICASQTKWSKGQFCRAQYSVDKQWYEAKIIAVDGAHCIVKYLGYMEHERQPLSSLKASAGHKQRQLQLKSIESDDGDEDDDDDGGDGDGAASGDEHERATADNESLSSEQSTSAIAAANKGQRERHATQSQHKRQQQQLEHLLHLQEQEFRQRQKTASSCKQKPASKETSSRKRGARESSTPSMIAFPPPPPPFPPGVDEICASDEALAAMLISWYISGYHTGYYTAVRQNSGR